MPSPDTRPSPPLVPWPVHVESSAAQAPIPWRILQRVLGERAELVPAPAPPAEARLSLAIEPGIGAEGFRITEGSPGSPAGSVRLVGNDPRGLLHAVGHFLHHARFNAGSVVPGPWRGQSVPHCPVRGIYFAFNFDNWYVSCPRDELARYAQDLALWGINSILISLIVVDPANRPAFEARRRDNREAIAALKSAGVDVGLLLCSNLIPGVIPADAQVVPVPDADPPRRGNGDMRVCPSRPSGRAALRRHYEQALDGYSDLGIDFVCTFPYDAGGCGCELCSPWGANGYVTATKDLAAVAHAQFPGCRVIVPTWCFDVLEQSEGEHEGLDRQIRADPSWADYIMADSHFDFPEWVLQHGAPGGLPLLNFPEISMWGRYPWGGYGANPLPGRCQRLWNQVRHLCRGGFPYSEGIFEDINKVIQARFYWDADVAAAQTLREYVAYEFSPDVVEDVTRAVDLLEVNWERATAKLDVARQAWALLADAQNRMPPQARFAWRWRILYLRALIDVELFSNPGQPHSDLCDHAYEELTTIYHAQRTGGPDAPRSRRCIERLRPAPQAPPPGGA